MRQAFDIHNAMGRFYDESIYQEALVQRCMNCGLKVNREVLVTARHQDFFKPYYIDMLIENGVVYETKTAEALNNSHEKQLLNYLLMTNLNHGKLINFRLPSVMSRFVSTRLRREDRITNIIFDKQGFNIDADNQILSDILAALLADWGAYLNSDLYRDALLHFTHGPDAGIKEIEIVVNGRQVGTQKMYLLNSKTAWHLSTIRQNTATYEVHLNRLLRHAKLNKMHWINLNKKTVTLKTIKNNSAYK